MASTVPLLTLTILATLRVSTALDPCPPCGDQDVPYPLSTSEDCGDPNYVLHCNNNVLEFHSIGGTPHMVLGIDPNTYSLIISPPSINPRTCYSSDVFEGGLVIDESSPFNISNRNTVMLFNCKKRILYSPLNCSSNSLCRRYEEVKAGRDCRNKLCCTYLKDSTATSHRIRVRVDGCTAYTSVVDIDPNVSPRLWNYGVHLQWLPTPTTDC